METTNKQLNDIQEELKNEVDMVTDDLSYLGGQETSKYDKYYFVKLHTKKEEQPHFTFARNNGTGTVVDVKNSTPIQTLQGKLTKISFSSYQHEKDTLKTVRFNLETLNNDGKLVGFSLGIGWNYALQNWVNCILGCDKPIDSILFSVWKDKQTGYNKSMIRINGGKPEWKFTNDELDSKKERVYDKKGVLVATRNGDLIDFLETELKNHLSVILPNFHPEQEEVKHQVNFVEVSIESVLGTDMNNEQQTDNLMNEMFNDIPTNQPSEQKLKNKKK